MYILQVVNKLIRNYVLYKFSGDENTCERRRRYSFIEGTNLWTSIFEKCVKTEIDFRLNFIVRKIQVMYILLVYSIILLTLFFSANITVKSDKTLNFVKETDTGHT